MGYLEYVEQVKEYIMLNWSTIVEYAALIVAYFLFILYESKVKSTKRDLTAMFTEKAAVVNKTDTNLRRDIKQVNARMERELSESKENYANAINEIAGLKKTVARMEQTLRVLLSDEEVNDGE